MSHVMKNQGWIWPVGMARSRSSKVKVTQSCLTLCDPMDCPWNSPGQNTGVGSLSLLQGIFPTPGIKPRDQIQVYDIAGRFVTRFMPGKPKNTKVSSLSPLQWFFLTQESNWGLLHCRWILYQLSYQGSLKFKRETHKIVTGA